MCFVSQIPRLLPATGVENSKEVLMTIPYDYDKGVTANWLWMNSWHKELKKKFLTNDTPNEAGVQRAVSQYIDLYEEETVGWMTPGFMDCNMMQKGICCMDSTTGKESL